MSSDDALFQAVAALNPVPNPGLMSDSELAAAAASRDRIVSTVAVPQRPRSRVRVPRFGSVVAWAAAAASLAIGATAIVTLRGQGAIRPATKPPAAAAQLVSKLAVLRRTQTPADRLPATVTRRFGLTASLTRLALTTRSSRGAWVRVYVGVQPLSYSGVGVRSSSPGALAVVIATGEHESSTVLYRAPAAGLSPPRFAIARNGFDTTLIPDGVTRVRWTFADRGAGTARSITIDPTVRGNVAIAPIPAGQGQIQTMTWYGPNGRVIASYDLASAQARIRRTQDREIAASNHRPIATSLLENFAVLSRSIGRASHANPPLPRGIAAQYATQSGGLNVGQTRFVPAPGTEPPVHGFPHGVWIIPGSHSLCFLDTELAGSCAVKLTGHGAPSNGTFMSTSIGHGIEWIEGVLPNTNHTVTVTLANGRAIRALVTDNVIAIAIRGSRATAIHTTDASGRPTTLRLGG